MPISEYDFELPQDLIAQEPLAERDASRMLSIERAGASIADRRFADLPRILKKGDLLVLNNTRVFPARLIGRTQTDARIEIFLVEEIEKQTWITLARPGRRLRAGGRVDFEGKLGAEILEKREDGKVLVRFDPSPWFDATVEEIGRTPLPPYIRRESASPDADRERYQTVFASRRGAIAAPTAGLHFSRDVFDELSQRGIDITEITLHVGYGTFEPVRANVLEEHKVAPERFEIGSEAADKLEKARRDRHRIVAVGTTTTRTLEYLMVRYGKFREASGRADLTILPGHNFAAIDALLTNFHLPESSLLILVATFGGHKLIMDAYRHAVASRYRFDSYGDCMLIE
ncbi:MAG: tRNA preQ1(34) S-adenosylmethionine ribosyltransferase-isomerase QueA [Pyrinomonadaceae bacterium]